MTKLGSKPLCFFILLCVVLSYTPTAVPQTETTGAIGGRVYEAGALRKGISGATVLVRNEDNGMERSVITNTNGEYFLATLPPAHYTITVTALGYEIQSVSDFAVRLSKTNVADVDLKPGSVSQTVTVKADFEGAALSKAPQISGGFSAREVAELPSNIAGGGIDTLALLIPGVTPSFGNIEDNGAIFSVNGNRSRSNNLTIDGQDNSEIEIGGPKYQVANQDLIADFQVITSNPPAQFGRNLAGALNIVTKSGTSDFHGTGFWFYRDRTFLDSENNIERASGTRDSFLPQLDNVFGGTVGGPIIRDKAFFFASYQGNTTRQNFISRSSSFAILPEEFARLKATFPGNNAIAALADFGAFALNDFGNVHPRTDVSNPFSTITLPLNPTLPATGANAVSFRVAQPEREFAIPSDEHSFSGRGDINVTNRDNVWIRYLFQNGQFGNALGTSSGFTGDESVSVHNISGSWNRQISDHFINEFRLSFTKFPIEVGGGCNRLKGCIPDPDQAATALTNISFPTFFPNISPFLVGLQTIGPSTSLPQARSEKTFQFTDYISFTLGQHQIISGLDIRVVRVRLQFLSSMNGRFSISSAARLVANSPSSVVLGVGEQTNKYNETDQAYFFQDDWKLRDNLTLSLGIRYEYTGQPINGIHDLTVKRESDPSTALWRQSLPIEARMVPKVPTDKNNFAPRLGFVYTPRFWEKVFGRDKTVVRGGYSILYDVPFYNIFFNVGSSSPAVFTNTVTNPAVGAGAVRFPVPDPVPTGGKVSAFAESAGLIARNTFDPRFFPQTTLAPDFHSPYSQQWSLGIQRQIGNNNIAEVRYVGNHGIGLFRTGNGNPFIANLVNGFKTNVSTDAGLMSISFPGFPNLVPPGITPLSCTDNPTTPDNEGVCNGRVLPRSTVRVRDNSGQSVYHSLQTSYKGRLFNQLILGTSYTLSKAIDNVSEIFFFNESPVSQSPFNITGAERGYSGFDRRHVLSVTGMWDIPLFKEQKGLFGHLLGGWQLNGIYYIASGQRFTPSQLFGLFSTSYSDTTFNSSTAGADGLRPFVGNPNAPRDSVGITAVDAALLFFTSRLSSKDMNAIYSLNELNTTGNIVKVSKNDVRYIFNGPGAALLFGSPFGNVARNTEKGPRINQLNVSFFKTTRVAEQIKVQLRTEIYNVFNHPSPGFGGGKGNTIPEQFIEDAGLGFNDFSQIRLNRRIVQLGLRVIF